METEQSTTAPAQSHATFTIAEGEPGFWLVTLEHQLNSRERFVLTLQTQRRNRLVSEVQADLLQRAIQTLQRQLDSLRPPAA